MTSIRNPIGIHKSNVDEPPSILDIYGPLTTVMETESSSNNQNSLQKATSQSVAGRNQEEKADL